ncbi:ubiquinone anaerobic biosynthesis accessory factor UbiT [Undibacterium pigrum]|uniref:Putative lipid carrier protein YhbT n=1 Tax=Undibacterium pigrum TaxID=401470 RepID=A0A318IP18_9BURK|nr:SCP2 sterol-binding domain-containing protein [Undibacterium pigrum]PXX37199.1 putative lipid carrier protein YhbT [Undibacterium pigrum]
MDLSNFRFPERIKTLGSYVPVQLANAPLILILELARRRALLVAPESLYDKSFRIKIEDLGLSLCFYCDQGKFKPLSSLHQPDVSLSACAMDFLKLATGQEDADTLFFRRRLKMEGDTELGIAVKYWLDASERPAWLARFGQRFMHAGEGV